MKVGRQSQSIGGHINICNYSTKNMGKGIPIKRNSLKPRQKSTSNKFLNKFISSGGIASRSEGKNIVSKENMNILRGNERKVGEIATVTGIGDTGTYIETTPKTYTKTYTKQDTKEESTESPGDVDIVMKVGRQSQSIGGHINICNYSTKNMGKGIPIKRNSLKPRQKSTSNKFLNKFISSGGIASRSEGKNIVSKERI